MVLNMNSLNCFIMSYLLICELNSTILKRYTHILKSIYKKKLVITIILYYIYILHIHFLYIPFKAVLKTIQQCFIFMISLVI